MGSGQRQRCGSGRVPSPAGPCLRCNSPPPCPSTPLSSRPLPRPCVGDVLGTLARGCSEAELLGDFPQLTHEDVLASLAFAAERERRLMVATLA